MIQVKRYWIQIDQWMKLNAPFLITTLKDGASPSQIKLYEAKFGCYFPKEYKILISPNNGQKTPPTDYFGNIGYLFLSPIHTVSGGLSGVTFGLMGAFSIKLLKKLKYLLIFIVSCFVNFIFLVFSTDDRIIFWAHLFGFLAGIFLGILFYFFNKKLNLKRILNTH